MFNDIKSGKLKASKEVQDIVSGRASGDPIDSFRTIYGEDALEQLDSLTPDLRQLRTEVDAEKLARSKFEFTPKLDRPKESYTPEEMKKILETEPEEFAKGGSVGLDYLTGQDSKVERKNYGFGSGLRAIIRAVPQPSSPPPITTPVVRPEDEILMRYREYMNTSKPSQSDLENRYRELIRSTPATGLPVSIPTPVNEGTTLVKGGLSFISPEGEKITFGSVTGFTKPNGEPYTGPVPENIRNFSMPIASDIRLKEDINLIGKSPSGINIYTFKYKGKDNAIYKGVMAQEVPYASVLDKDGFYKVDYSKVDVKFEKVNK